MKRIFTFMKGPGGAVELLKIAAPLIVSYACDTIMMFTDRLFLAKLSGAHMSAAMAGGLTAFMCSTFFVGLIGYTTAMVAQRLGAEKKERCAVITTQGFVIAFGAYPVMLAMIPLGRLAFVKSGIDNAQLTLQTDYFRLMMFGSLIPLIRSVFGNFFSGIGRTRLVMLAAVVSMIANVGLNYILIFGKLGMPALGIHGAAYGTIIAGFVGICILFLSYIRKSNREEFNIGSSFRFDKTVMKELWRLGAPSGAELFMNLVAFTAMITIFHGQGIVVASAVTITFNWDMVAFIPLLGINVGVTTLVGRYVGRKDLATAHNAMKSGLLLAFAYVIGLMILFVAAPGPLVELFRPDRHAEYWGQIYPLAVSMVELISVYLLADAVTIVFSGALRGAGDTFWTMVLSVAMHWVLALLTFICFFALNQSAYATWVAVVVVFCLLASTYMLRYFKGNWQEKALALEA